MAQENFQRMYDFGNKTCIQDVYLTDSCYYFTGSDYTTNSNYNAVFGKIALNGELLYAVTDSTPTEIEWQKSSRTQLQTNYRGNLMTSCIQVDLSYEWPCPVIKEYNLDGTVLDSIRVVALLEDSVKFRTSIKVIAHNSDSTYFVLADYEDLTPWEVSPAQPVLEEFGAIVMKLNLLGDTIWTKRFKFHWAGPINPTVKGLEMYLLNDTTLIVSVLEDKGVGSSKWSRIKIHTLSLDGALLDTKVFQDGLVMRGKSGFLPLEDGTFIHSYNDTRLNDDNTPDYEAQGVLARFDQNNQIIWKDSLHNFRGTFGFTAPNRLRFVDSTSFVGVFHRYEQDTAFPYLYQYARFFKRKITGEVMWERDFYIGNPDSMRGDYDMIDLELTPDGGFLASGTIRKNTLNPYTYVGDYAYLLKTNCLGFIDDPIASVQYEINENLEVNFINTSQNAGSFEWDFGDYTHLNHGEGEDTLTHAFPGFGPYTVTLIANGCPGRADTVSVVVNPINHFDPEAVLVDQGIFLIFPNPIFAGSGLFVYLNDLDHTQNDVFVDIYSGEGKRVKTIQIVAQEGVYQIDKSISQGNYYAVLRKGETVLEREKLIIY